MQRHDGVRRRGRRRLDGGRARGGLAGGLVKELDPEQERQERAGVESELRAQLSEALQRAAKAEADAGEAGATYRRSNSGRADEAPLPPQPLPRPRTSADDETAGEVPPLRMKSAAAAVDVM